MNPDSLPLSVVFLLDCVDLDPTVFHSVRPRKSYSASLVTKLAKRKVNFSRRINVDINDNVGDNRNHFHLHLGTLWGSLRKETWRCRRRCRLRWGLICLTICFSLSLENCKNMPFSYISYNSISCKEIPSGTCVSYIVFVLKKLNLVQVFVGTCFFSIFFCSKNINKSV